ncbi:MAG: family 16 glycosylhydrolase [Candidatus Omnitrophica bacterium]|nr:family 16 glycosylhydrolase [Candidatus Omnitrophota bacterium]
MKPGIKFKILRSVIISGLILTNSCFAASPTVPAKQQGWYLTWHDEFEGNRLDESKWRIEDAAFAKNNELQYYTPEDVFIRDGMLVLRSRKNVIGGCEYSSGLVETRGKFAQQYGRVEIRAQLPKGKGVWPAHWMLPASCQWPPEIDIMEVLGHQPHVMYMTVHWGTWQDRKKKGSLFIGPDFSNDFHEFAIEWDNDSITWFVDGTKRLEISEYVPHEPFYIILNTAIGGDWPGKPNRRTLFPQYHNIDYVRVYAKEIPGYYYLSSLAEYGRVNAVPCLPYYQEKTEVTLNAQHKIGYKFSHWSGDLQGNKNPAAIVMDKHKKIIAHFEKDLKPLQKLSANKRASASSIEAPHLSAGNVVDGDLKTRWSSEFSDLQWVQIDLGEPCLIEEIRLIWEVAFARAYEIQVSNDAKQWRTVYSTQEGQGTVEEIIQLNAKARYISMRGTQRAREFGYSLWEFEVFGQKLSLE